jgi:hypothetical protein
MYTEKKNYDVQRTKSPSEFDQCIPPSTYATLFKSSLESDQFEKMIDLLQQHEKSLQNIYNVLEGLSQVKRIDMLVMFLGKKQQQGKTNNYVTRDLGVFTILYNLALQELFDLLKHSSDGVPKETLAKLAKIYNTRI